MPSQRRGFDALAKEALRGWPTRSKKLWPLGRDGGAWLKAQPVEGGSPGPRLMAVGTDAFKTQPDGLWVFVSAQQGFADCIAIEACSAAQNFADKRSRYHPSTTARVLECGNAWLRHSNRWQWAGFDDIPKQDCYRFPIRFARVLFFLEDDLYARWSRVSIPDAHEFVASYSSIKSYKSQKMQSFLRRMSPEQHFYRKGKQGRPN